MSAIETNTKIYNDQCSVCLDDFNLEDQTTTLSCGHKFHVGCIIKCLRKSNECPNCRDTDGNPISKSQTGNGFINFIGGDFEFSNESSEEDDYSDFLESIKKLLRQDRDLAGRVKEYKKLCKTFHRKSVDTNLSLDRGLSKSLDDFRKSFKTSPEYLEYKGQRENYRYELAKLKRRLQSVLEKNMDIPKDANSEYVNKYLNDMFHGDWMQIYGS